jgi:L-fuculose-phosphate aldolase
MVVTSWRRAVTWRRSVFPGFSGIPMGSDRHDRLAIVQFGRMLYENGFVAATDGNLSVRLDDKRVLVTPTCISKGRMRSSDMVIVDMDGRRLAGKRRVSTEIGMHLLIYRLRPDVQGIVHAHPPTATGFAASGYDLNRPLVCEVVVGLGSIPLARYGTPGTPELTDALEPLIPHHDAILMANHGVVTFGSSVESAYMKMETVEHFAKIALVTHLLGNEQPLGEKEVQKLHEVRHRYNGGGGFVPPRRPVAADLGASDLQSDDEPRETAGSRR